MGLVVEPVEDPVRLLEHLQIVAKFFKWGESSTMRELRQRIKPTKELADEILRVICVSLLVVSLDTFQIGQRGRRKLYFPKHWGNCFFASSTGMDSPRAISSSAVRTRESAYCW